ncbi:WD40 repeat-like protein [Suillus weaverae]|nr:WD40 repeat-like protein [Suillus weaverae]
MGHPASAKHENLATMPYRKIEVKNGISRILSMPGRQQIIIYSQWDGSFRVWDLERGTQVGEEWEDKRELGVSAIALSPGGKTLASGNWNGEVKLWNIDTGKVIKTLTGHTKGVWSVCWSPNGERVVSGHDETIVEAEDGAFRVWDVESGETILGPIKTGHLRAVCYSPDAKMIATAGNELKIWDANSGELLKTFEVLCGCLAWTSDGKTLFAGEAKIDTATWTVLDVRENLVNTILLSPNECILASISYFDNTAELWNLETNQPIGTPLHHQDYLNSTTFSADGKFLITSCQDNHIYTWDVSAILKQAGLPSDIADATPRPAPKMKGAPRIPPGFFNDAIRDANLRTGLSQSHGLHNSPTPAPRQRTLSPFSSFWRRSKSHGATEPDTKSPLSWTRNLFSMLRRRDGSDIQLREVEVPYTAGKPRNYHARKKKPAASSSRSPNTQQPNAATQSTPSSSQQPPPTTAASTPSAAVGTAGTTGAVSRPHITGGGWRAPFRRSRNSLISYWNDVATANRTLWVFWIATLQHVSWDGTRVHCCNPIVYLTQQGGLHAAANALALEQLVWNKSVE